MRTPGVWVHVDDKGRALAEDMVWPRDHDPVPHRVEVDRQELFGRVRAEIVASRDESVDIDIRWGDGLVFDSSWWRSRWRTSDRWSR